MLKQTAQLRFLRMAPRKVRLVADTVKGLPVDAAEAQLMLQTRRAAKPILKLLRSAIANAKNNKLNPETLVVSSIRVDQGPMLKRYLPRARGSASPIQKKMSHIFLELSESPKAKKTFSITPLKRVKSEKVKKAKESPKKPEEQQKAQRPAGEKPEGFKRFFRRKSV